jgi:putative addiction module killer protein
MNTILYTQAVIDFLQSMRDRVAKKRILTRIIQAENGNFGDVQPVGQGVSEMRIDVGAGYRVYFIRTDLTVYLLLCAGDKSTQPADIKKSHHIAKLLKRS